MSSGVPVSRPGALSYLSLNACAHQHRPPPLGLAPLCVGGLGQPQQKAAGAASGSLCSTPQPPRQEESLIITSGLVQGPAAKPRECRQAQQSGRANAWGIQLAELNRKRKTRVFLEPRLLPYLL